MQNAAPYSRFAKNALTGFALFLIAYALFAFFRLRGNLYVSSHATAALLGAFCLLAVPWWLGAGVVWTFVRKQRLYVKAISIVLLAVSLAVAGTMGVLLTTLALDSTTDQPAHYLVFDEGVFWPETARQLFPQAPPRSAVDLAYYYAYGTFLSDALSVRAAWTLPGDEFAEEVRRVRGLLIGAAEEKNDQGETVLSWRKQAPDGEFYQLYASFRDETNSIQYLYMRGQS